MNLDFGYDSFINRVLCKNWKFKAKIWQGHRRASETQSSEYEARAGKASAVGFHEPLSPALKSFPGCNEVPLFRWLSIIPERDCHEFIGPFLINGCISFPGQQKCLWISPPRKELNRNLPTRLSLGSSILWGGNKSEDTHYRIWRPRFYSHLSLLSASHSVPLDLYFPVNSNIIWDQIILRISLE